MIAVFDIGGTSIKYGVIQGEKTLRFLVQKEVSTDAKQIQGKGIQEKVMRIIEVLKQTYEIRGIAISTAGMVDAKTGTILYANDNIPGYTGCTLKADFEEQFHIPCWVENDVNAAALGEASYGAGMGMQSMMMLTIGTGIGGAIVINKKIHRGYSEAAGEIGYMWMGEDRFEAIASTTALVRYVATITKEDNLNGRIIFERAKQGDLLCRQSIDKVCDAIAKGISNCVYMLNPQMVVLGGGIMAQAEVLEPIIDTYMKQYLQETIREHTIIAFAKLGNTAGMMGAYAYYMKKVGEEHA